MQTYQDIEKAFSPIAKEHGFEFAFTCVSPHLSHLAGQTWLMAFDTLYFSYLEYGEPVEVSRRDALAVSLCPAAVRNDVAAELRQQQRDAKAWAKELDESGMTPAEAVAGSLKVSEGAVQRESLNVKLAQAPSALTIPQAIVSCLRSFYRADKRFSPQRSNILKPLEVSQHVISRSHSTGEALQNEVFGALVALMTQVRRGTAKGRWVISDKSEERRAVSGFANLITYALLAEKWGGDKSKFASRDFSLIKDAVWALYLLEQDKENAQQS